MLVLSYVLYVANIILTFYGHFQITFLEDILYAYDHFLFDATKM